MHFGWMDSFQFSQSTMIVSHSPPKCGLLLSKFEKYQIYTCIGHAYRHGASNVIAATACNNYRKVLDTKQIHCWAWNGKFQFFQLCCPYARARVCVCANACSCAFVRLAVKIVIGFRSFLSIYLSFNLKCIKCYKISI